MLIKIAELDFSWPSFNSGLYWVALGLNLICFTVAGTVNEFHIIPHHDSALLQNNPIEFHVNNKFNKVNKPFN